MRSHERYFPEYSNAPFKFEARPLPWHYELLRTLLMTL